MAFNPLVATGWSWRPVWLLLGVTSVAGALAVAVAFALVMGSTGNTLLASFTLLIGVIVAVPTAIGAATAGWIGWFLGAKAGRPALGALAGTLVLAGAEASLILLSLDGFTEWVIWLGVAGTAAAAVVFFFEVLWHRSANEVAVSA